MCLITCVCPICVADTQENLSNSPKWPQIPSPAKYQEKKKKVVIGEANCGKLPGQAK